MKNFLIIHGGGPTAVMNESLVGAVRETAGRPDVGAVFGALGGTGGLLRRQLIDLKKLSQQKLDLIRQTPGSAIGTSRDHLEPEDYDQLAEIILENNIQCVLMNGGNGTMEACGHLYERLKNHQVAVMGIPKTMDNDLAITDHSPGFGSAARYLAGSVAEVIADVKSLPIHVVIIEAFGRNAGWLAASASLAADCGLGGPDLIYLPERDFVEDAFLSDVQNLINQRGFGVIVASEGLHTHDGQPIVRPVFETDRSTYFGDVSAHLAGLITRRLGFKARSEKPGLLSRASIPWRSELDCQEAAQAGAYAAACAVTGTSGKMVGFGRRSGDTYHADLILIDIADVMLQERKLPDEFINPAGNGVTESFRAWCRPLIGSPLPNLMSLV